MTWMDETIMGLNSHEAQHDNAFGLAVARELKRRNPYNTSGVVATDLRCTKKAAENLLAGHLSGKSITRLTRAYGLGFMIDVSAAVAGETLETFIRNRGAEARREADYWAALEARETPIARTPPPSDHPRPERRSWSRRDP
jgi:hypothetical protein